MIVHFEMDLTKTLEELRGEKERLDRAIAVLEQLQAGTWVNVATGQRRGRKSMTDEERREVSERMKKYWARKRKQDQPRS